MAGVAFLVKGMTNNQPQSAQVAQSVAVVSTPAATPPSGITASESATAGSSASGSAAQGAEKDFTVEGSNYKFAPSTLTVNKVKITFKNSGGFHDFVLDEFGVKTKVIPSGQSATVEFTADKTGTFDYYCSVGNHRAMGMQGTLTVL